MSGAIATLKVADSLPTEADEAMQVDASPAPHASLSEDLYSRLKTLQRQLEFIEIQVSCASTAANQAAVDPLNRPPNLLDHLSLFAQQPWLS